MSRFPVAVLALTLLVGACASQSPAPIRVKGSSSVAYHRAHNVPSHGVAIEGYCPVAYHAVGGPVRGQAQYAAEYEGITYWMASEGALDLFRADPAKYIPAYGGWCAFGMSVEDKFPIDPHSFEIVDGQLLLFLNNPGVDARALWNQGDEDTLQAKADAHWHKVSN